MGSFSDDITHDDDLADLRGVQGSRKDIGKKCLGQLDADACGQR
jgi:hypothetical protein